MCGWRGREERGGEDQGTGNHRYVQDGGWVAWWKDRENVQIVEEARNSRLDFRRRNQGRVEEVVGSNPGGVRERAFNL